MPRLMLVLAAVAATLVACTPPHAGPSLTDIRVALPGDWITWLPVELAQTLGYAQQEGLGLTIAETTGLAKGMEALLGRSVDVTAGTLSQAIQLATDHRDVRCFVTLYTRSPIALAVAPAMTGTIRTPRDLKGHRIGVASPGSASHQFLAFLLASNGMSLSDVDAIGLGTGAPSVAALEHGTVDAGVLLGAAIPTLERRHPGVTLLVDTRTPEGTTHVFGTATFRNTCLIAQDRWLRANVDVAGRLVRAVRRAMQWMGRHTAEEIRAAMPATLHIPDAEAELQAIRQAQEALSPDGVMTAESAELLRRYVTMIGDKARLAEIDLASTYTNEFVAGK